MAIQTEIRLLKQAQFHRLMRQVLNEVAVGPIERFPPDLILWFRRMLGTVHLLNEMALAACDAVQRRITRFCLINKELCMIGEFPHVRSMTPEAQRLILSCG